MSGVQLTAVQLHTASSHAQCRLDSKGHDDQALSLVESSAKNSDGGLTALQRV